MTRHRSDIDTRSALVEAAWMLLVERGWDDTTVNAVIDRAGLSKGTFYHWFASREALLDAVCEAFLERALGTLLAPSDGAAVDRLRALLDQSRRWRIDHAGALGQLSRVLYREENEVLRRRLEQRRASSVVPLLADTLSDGVRDGSFTVDDPATVAEILYETSSAVGALQMRQVLDGGDSALVSRRARSFLRFLERGLGAPEGSLSDVGDDFDEHVAAFLDGRMP